MAYNYSVKIGETFNIKTPNNTTVDVSLKTDGKININHSIYPDGFEITMTQMNNRINITTNMELIKHNDGFYYIKSI